jgi:hypothetical protein
MPPDSPAGTRARAGEVVARWTRAGVVAGLAIGGCYGALLVVVVVTLTRSFGASGLIIFAVAIGSVTGLFAGLVVGLLDGLLLALLRPAPAYAALAAAACTELILLPVQVWLWVAIHSVAYLPVVAAPTAASLGVAAWLGERLPPGAGSRSA